MYFSFTSSSLLISSSSANLKAFNSKVKEEYHKLWEGVDRGDAEEVERITLPILDELESMELQEGMQLSPITRMKSTLAQAQRMVRLSKQTSSTMTYYFDQAEAVARANDIQLLGAVIYTGNNPAARQISAVFAGSDLCREVIDAHETSIRDVIDTITTELKYVLGYHVVVRDQQLM